MATILIIDDDRRFRFGSKGRKDLQVTLERVAAEKAAGALIHVTFQFNPKAGIIKCTTLCVAKPYEDDNVDELCTSLESEVHRYLIGLWTTHESPRFPT